MSAATQHAVQNDDPIVLVHGFGGWGRDELFGSNYYYWGGKTDIQQHLIAQGHHTCTAAVGPFSSNWDRAVELYHQIAGGRVDYGAAHARQHGHERYGRTFPPLVPGWNGEHRVHLIAHSQGAPTSRMLVQLLREGSAEERAAPDAGMSELFKGGKDWVRSVTSVAGANNGTTIGRLTSFDKLARQLLKIAGAGVGQGENPQDLPIDFKLDQWGLVRRPDESRSGYWDRVWASPIWQARDMALDSLTPEGAEAERAWVKPSPEVYYFYYTNSTTIAPRFTWFGLVRNHKPRGSTNPILLPFALGMGAYHELGDQWLENDGVVNTCSTGAPFNEPSLKYDGDGTARRGIWNHMGFLEKDHWDVVGSGDLIADPQWLRSFYLEQARRLKGLPVS